MYLSRIEARNFRLQGQDIIWDLNPDVNILVGYNGCGKTSLLKMIYELYTQQESEGTYCATISKQGVDNMFLFMGNRRNAYSIKSYPLRPIHYLETELEIELINTFDVSLAEESTKIFENQLNSSFLDIKLAQKKNDFLLFNGSISKDLEKLHFSSETLTVEEQQEIDKRLKNAAVKRKQLIQIIDKAFEETQKTLDIVNHDFTFLDAGKNEILISELSSGEKQLLYILLSVFLQNEQPYILLLDEPEISMHIYWQREFIEMIRTINPNCQLIIATHSASIISQGWFDKMKNWEDLIFPNGSKNSLIESKSMEEISKREKRFSEAKIFLQSTNTLAAIILTLSHLNYLTYEEAIKYGEILKVRSRLGIEYFIFEFLSIEQINTLLEMKLIKTTDIFLSNAPNLKNAILLATDYLTFNYPINVDFLWRKATNELERLEVIEFAVNNNIPMNRKLDKFFNTLMNKNKHGKINP